MSLHPGTASYSPGGMPPLPAQAAQWQTPVADDQMDRLRGKIKYRPVVFELMPEAFTLLALQRAVEAIAGAPLHKQNFRRALERGELVEGLGRIDADTGGRPAELFRFRRESLNARPVSGLSLPLLRD